MYLLDTYVPKVFEGKNLEQEWSRFKRRAEAVNNKISISFYNNLVNYCFVGSSVKFQKIDIWLSKVQKQEIKLDDSL